MSFFLVDYYDICFYISLLFITHAFLSLFLVCLDVFSTTYQYTYILYLSVSVYLWISCLSPCLIARSSISWTLRSECSEKFSTLYNWSSQQDQRRDSVIRNKVATSSCLCTQESCPCYLLECSHVLLTGARRRGSCPSLRVALFVLLMLREAAASTNRLFLPSSWNCSDVFLCLYAPYSFLLLLRSFSSSFPPSSLWFP